MLNEFASPLWTLAILILLAAWVPLLDCIAQIIVRHNPSVSGHLIGEGARQTQATEQIPLASMLWAAYKVRSTDRSFAGNRSSRPVNQ